MKKYVFFDIDGTLLPLGEKNIPQNTIKAIQKLKQNGIEPFICTGRCYMQAKQYIEEIGAQSFIVSNGQEINLKGEEIYSYDIPSQTVIKLVEILNNLNIHWGYETRERIYLNQTDYAPNVKELLLKGGMLEVEIKNLEKRDKIKQFWAFSTKEKLDELLKKLPQELKGFRWHDQALEIVAQSESKGKAVEIIKKTNSDVKTYAFGDGINDLELLQTVDYGVAMENGLQEIKDIAYHVTGRSEQNGIEEGLKHLALI